MNHDWFRHVEIELFVARGQVHDAMELVQDVLVAASGEPLRDRTSRALQSLGLLDALGAISGRYTHHYPICERANSVSESTECHQFISVINATITNQKIINSLK